MPTCKLCNYKTDDISNWSKHCKTKKHNEKVNDDNKTKTSAKTMQNRAKNSTKNSTYNCTKCTNIYTSKSTLNRHIRLKHNDKITEIEQNNLHDLDEVNDINMLKHIIKSIITKQNINTNAESSIVSQKYPNSIPKVSKIICPNCEQEFTKINNMYRHRKRCTNKLIDDATTKLIINHKDELLEVHKTTNKITSKGLSALNYAMIHFTDAPSLGQLEHQETKQLIYKDKDDEHIVAQVLLSEFKYNSLAKYIGDEIVGYYKRDNINDQSFHSTDCVRLNYIIKDIVDDNKSEWIKDDGGIRMNKKIIEPLLAKVKDIITDYCYYLFENDRLDKETRENMYKIKDIIDDRKLHKDVSRFIAPHFKFMI